MKNYVLLMCFLINHLLYFNKIIYDFKLLRKVSKALQASFLNKSQRNNGKTP